MTSQQSSLQMDKHHPVQELEPANAVSSQARPLEMPIHQIHVPVSKPVNSIHPYFNCNIQASNSDKYDDLKHQVKRLKRMMKRKEGDALLAETKARKKAGENNDSGTFSSTSREEDPHPAGLSALSQLRVQHLEHELQRNTKALRNMTKVMEKSSPHAEFIPDPVESSWY